MKNKYSIIVAVYNIENYVDQCVDSIVGQAYDNIEILLVNDGSTDASLLKCNSWAESDSRIRVIDKPNGGLSSARNEGLKHATGDYVLFVDGDDWLESNIIEKLEAHIRSIGSVDILCFSYSVYFSENSQQIKGFKIDSKVYSGVDFFEKSDFKLQAWNKAYRREYLNEINLDFLHGRLHEDISYTIPLCLSASRVSFIPNVGYYYRQNREGSIMWSIKERNVLDFSNALCFDYYYLKEHKILTEYFKKWLISQFYYSCFTFRNHYLSQRRCLRQNNVNIICAEIGCFEDRYLFDLKLFRTHLYMKFKYFGGMFKRKIISQKS